MMLKEMLEHVRERAPVIHNITNRVSVNDCANILLACGASPIMAEAIEEVEEVTALCDGLVLNLGMPTGQKIEAMKRAGRKANALQIPVVLDPVGVGASSFRREAVSELLNEVQFSVIRGNTSEIRVLLSGEGEMHGVDAVSVDGTAEKKLFQVEHMTKELAKRTGAIIVTTGEADFVSDGKRTYRIRNGNGMMQKVTGMGCQLSVLVTAYVAANPRETLEAVTAAVCAMGVCGELAYKRMSDLDGNASYRNYVIDAVCRLDEETLVHLAQVERVDGNGEKNNEM